LKGACAVRISYVRAGSDYQSHHHLKKCDLEGTKKYLPAQPVQTDKMTSKDLQQDIATEEFSG
jgi:hypothetical protein